MVRLLVLSDSHGDRELVERVVERHRADVDEILHCGDSELRYGAKELKGVTSVRGNCDLDPDFPEEETISLGGLKIYATHGHLYNVKMSLMPLNYRAEEKGASIICFGHSHIAGSEMYSNKIFINPGSLSLPRRRQEKTYAICEWDHPHEIHVAFFDEAGNEVTDLQRNYSLSE